MGNATMSSKRCSKKTFPCLIQLKWPSLNIWIKFSSMFLCPSFEMFSASSTDIEGEIPNKLSWYKQAPGEITFWSSTTVLKTTTDWSQRRTIFDILWKISNAVSMKFTMTPLKMRGTQAFLYQLELERPKWLTVFGLGKGIGPCVIFTFCPTLCFPK